MILLDPKKTTSLNETELRYITNIQRSSSGLGIVMTTLSYLEVNRRNRPFYDLEYLWIYENCKILLKEKKKSFIPKLSKCL